MTRLLLCVWLCLALSGCGRKQAAPTPTPAAGAAALSQSADQTQPAETAGDAAPSRQTPVPGSASESAPVAPAAAPQPAAVPAQPVPLPAGDFYAVLSSLTQGLRRYGVEKQRVPASLNEVIAAGYIPVMPQPPPGKKFALDAKRMEVVLVRQ